jgi:hypothetical protein
LVDTVLKDKIRPKNGSLLQRVERSWRQSLDQWQEKTLNMPSMALAVGFMQRLG